MAKIVLESDKSVLADNHDLFVVQELQQQTNFLPLDDLQKIVSSYDIFLQEREKSFDYRIYGNVTTIASNVLCQLEGDLGFEGVEAEREFDDESQKYMKSLDEVLFKNDGWFYYIKNEDNCIKYELEPTRMRFDLKNTSDWNLFVTYPAKKNHIDLKFNDISLNDGIAIMGGNTVIVDGKEMTYLILPISHNLISEDKVNIYNINGLIGTFAIYKAGLDNNTYQKNTIIIDSKLDFANFGPLQYRLKKVLNNQESEYYSRWNKKLTVISDYDIFNTAFSKNVFSDKNCSFIFRDSINIENLTSHLDQPITELYLSIVKKTDDIFWGNVISCTNTYLYGIDYDFNSVAKGVNLNPIETTITGNEEYMFSGIYEYNSKTLVETELSFAVHIFNTQQRIDNGILESYYYKPHYKGQIKTFSDYIVKDDGSEDVPFYANIDTGIYQWKEISNSEIPYLNKNHYLYFNINLFIRRQDPCVLYGLSNNALIAGNCIDMDTEKIININKIC